jgi:hypothetical protein
MASEDENTCKQFIKKFNFMMIIFFLIVLMVAGFTVAIIFTLKKKATTCTRTCMEGEKCNCSKCTSRCNSDTLLDNEKLRSDCGCELDYRNNKAYIISSEKFDEIGKLENCPDFDERYTLIDGKTKAVPYPNKGYNCQKPPPKPVGRPSPKKKV